MLDYRERIELKEYLEQRKLRARLLFIRGLIILIFAACFVGLYYLQVTQSERYGALAEANRLRRVVLRPPRGNMYDRYGRQIVGNRKSFDVVIDREKLSDPARVARMVAPALGMSEALVLERIERYRLRPPYEPAILKEDVDFAEISQLEARRYEIPEISVNTESRRHYPDGPALAHVVGYVGEATESQLAAEPGLKMGDIVGKSGLEKTYDQRLRGRSGEQLVEVNSIGRPLGPVFVGTRAEPGTTLHLALDMDLQRTLVQAFGPEAGAGVFLDPRNGDILALISMPAFDPNAFASRFSLDQWRTISADPLKPLQNRAITGTYSPGSTFKLAVAIAALEEGVVDAGSVVHCGGGAYFYGRRYGCWKKGGHGAVDLHRAIVQSCNVYFYTVGQRLGIDNIAKYASGLGFGAPTGVDVPGEKGGLVPSEEWSRSARGQPWYAGETISVSIGQGPMLVTALQMADMAACVANGGRIFRPRVARAGPGTSFPAEPIGSLQLSPRTLQVIRHAMWGVVHESGTGGRARMEDVTVAGKTGTVQVYKASAGVDSDKLDKPMRDHAWFVGYAPMENPEIAFAVFVEHGGHGGAVSAPIVKNVLEVYFARDRRPGLGPAPGEPVRPPPQAATPLIADAAAGR